MFCLAGVNPGLSSTAESGEHFVRVLYNGVAQAVCDPPVDGQLCRWEDFNAKLRAWIPAKGQCAQFYDFYSSLALKPPP
jgi:hypothetical protein